MKTHRPWKRWNWIICNAWRSFKHSMRRSSLMRTWLSKDLKRRRQRCKMSTNQN